MLTIDILKKPPFSLNDQESLDLMDLSKRFDIILDDLFSGEVYTKFSSEVKQELVIAMFKSWTKNPSNHYIPAFNGSLVERLTPQNGDGIRPAPKIL